MFAILQEAASDPVVDINHPPADWVPPVGASRKTWSNIYKNKEVCNARTRSSPLQLAAEQPQQREASVLVCQHCSMPALLAREGSSQNQRVCVLALQHSRFSLHCCRSLHCCSCSLPAWAPASVDPQKVPACSCRLLYSWLIRTLPAAEHRLLC